MVNKNQGWEHIRKLADTYLEEVADGHGVGNAERSPIQVKIAQDIIERTIPFLYDVVGSLTSPHPIKGMYLRIKGSSKRIMVSLRKGIELDELVNQGAIGIINGLKRFDPNKGNIYAFIKATVIYEILNSFKFKDNSGLIRLTQHFWDNSRNILNDSSLDRKEFLDNLVEQTGASYETASLIYCSQREQFLNIDDLVAKDSPILNSLIDRSLVENQVAEGLEENLIFISVYQNVLKTIDFLSDKEKFVIRKRFGIEDGICYTLEEIGTLLGVTRERIRQIEAKSLDKLRKKIISAGSAF